MNSIPDSYNFSGKNVLIVGGSKGFGAGLVSKFACSGANVFYISRFENLDLKGKHIQVDLSIQTLKFALKDIEMIGVDILVNCAAINHAKKTMKY